MFGDIKDSPAGTGKDIRGPKLQPQPKNKGGIFATTVTLKDKNGKGTKEKESLSDLKICLFCEGEHALDMCSKLEKRTHNGKIASFREKGVCFGCL